MLWELIYSKSPMWLNRILLYNPISVADNYSIRHGLSSTEAASRLGRDGLNKVKGAQGISLWKILLRQVSNSLTLVREAFISRVDHRQPTGSYGSISSMLTLVR